jgi:5'-3' exonuclease
MGIDGLLKFLQPIITHEHLSTLKNTTAAIDIMNWIYRAYYLHAPDIRNNAQSTAYLNFIQQMLDLFQLYHIDIICVFDGRFVSSKQATVDKRRQLKEANRKKGEELL